MGRPLRLDRSRNWWLSSRCLCFCVIAWNWGSSCGRSGVALIAVSAAIQLASLAFWLPLEIYQMETLGHPTFVVALRFKNIVAFALGKMDAWGLNNHAMTEDPWDYVHITTWNFLPFVLRRVGEAPGWVVKVCFELWAAGIAALTGFFGGCQVWARVTPTRMLFLSELVPRRENPCRRGCHGVRRFIP